MTDWLNASPIEGAVIRLREGWNNRSSEYVKFELSRMNGNLSQSSVRITITYPDGNTENIQWDLSEPGMVLDVFQIEDGDLTILNNVANEPTLP